MQIQLLPRNGEPTQQPSSPLGIGLALRCRSQYKTWPHELSREFRIHVIPILSPTSQQRTGMEAIHAFYQSTSMA